MISLLTLLISSLQTATCTSQTTKSKQSSKNPEKKSIITVDSLKPHRFRERQYQKMTSLGGLEIIVSSFLCLLLVLVLIKILYKLWLAPARLQKLMASQGIKGPPYRLVHGNTKDISNMIKEAMSKPKSLSSSHDVLSIVQPHVHSWTKIYGKNYLQWHGSKPQLVITEPELCKEILNNKDKAYPKIEPESFAKKLKAFIRDHHPLESKLLQADPAVNESFNPRLQKATPVMRDQENTQDLWSSLGWVLVEGFSESLEFCEAVSGICNHALVCRLQVESV